MDKNRKIEEAYRMARDMYAEIGVDTDEALKMLDSVNISLHCWQADDVGGFESPDSRLGGGGIQVTGNYPGKARSIDELIQDIDKVMSLLPGRQRLNLHAIYGDFGGRGVDRDEIEPVHFQRWIDWAKDNGTGLDFNPTCFSHPFADNGYTLSDKNQKHRRFWIEHVKRCREIASVMGRELGTAAVNNIWIPDGSKDVPVDRNTHRSLLKESLDEIFSVEYPSAHLIDSLESKLFGIGSEAMVVGSLEFYIAYALQKGKMVCIDNGHFHPTEQAGDKISALLQFFDGLLLHLTRGVRWDSDHVVTFNDEIQLIAQEVVRCKALDRVRVGLDFFDASINRVGAYVTGVRAAQTAFLYALLEPVHLLRKFEEEGRYFERLAYMEIMKTRPFGAVYDYYCLTGDVPVSVEYTKAVAEYEKTVLSKRV
ncbi:MAG: L-rhamnose isomerase [Marinilabiliales bacterium]|nr:MAG: L-rhamnose isomerase [Marinilabiliales bacterium]